MEMKEIIIDGVNVAGCNLYMEHLHEDAYEDDGCVDVDNFCCLHMDECEKCPNCYFKQLQRAKQENARLKEEFALTKKSNDLLGDYGRKLQQALEEIKFYCQETIKLPLSRGHIIKIVDEVLQ